MNKKLWLSLLFALSLCGGQGCAWHHPRADGHTGYVKLKSAKYRDKASRRKEDASRAAKAPKVNEMPPELQAFAPMPLPVKEESSVVRAAHRLQPGDQLIISLRGIPREEKIEDVIDEDGFIALAYINTIRAAGRTASELERAIRREYLDKKIYKNVSVNVIVPSQSYFVRGEIKKPGRYPLVSGVTVIQAIATAGGYTGFANPRKVKLLRDGKATFMDIRLFERYPERDKPVEVGDVIVVPRSVF